jgi:hypothetical protein
MNNTKMGVLFLQHHPEFNILEADYFLEGIKVNPNGNVPYNHVTYKSYKTRPDYETLKNDVISVLSK